MPGPVLHSKIAFGEASQIDSRCLEIYDDRRQYLLKSFVHTHNSFVWKYLTITVLKSYIYRKKNS